VARETEPETELQIPGHIKQILEEFSDVLPKNLPGELSPMRDIQHVIDQVTGATLSNLPNYRMNLVEHAKLKGRAYELLDRVHQREFEPMCGSRTLAPKKDGAWRMRVDSHAINKITVTYHFLILRLDDMLDLMLSAPIFSNINVKSMYHQIQIRPRDE